jgi:hypothetical protein
MPAERLTDKLILPNLNRDCDIIAAGEHPVFGAVNPDDFTAYAIVKFSRAAPMVMGPESRTGAIFVIHPAVVARSFHRMLHKQMNMGHTLVALGSKEDRICGCVLGCTFPEEPEGGWVIPEKAEDAPEITAFAALHKQAKGVDKMLGGHLSGKVKMAVSMEFTFYRDEVGIYDPSTRTVYDRKDIPANLKGYVAEDKEGRLFLVKSARTPALQLAIGGVSGELFYRGIGYTDRPAEASARVESFAASRREGMMVCEAWELPAWSPGMNVTWQHGQFCRGVVKAVHLEGRHCRHGMTLEATFEDPALDVLMPNGVMILRHASTVVKKI